MPKVFDLIDVPHVTAGAFVCVFSYVSEALLFNVFFYRHNNLKPHTEEQTHLQRMSARHRCCR